MPFQSSGSGQAGRTAAAPKKVGAWEVTTLQTRAWNIQDLGVALWAFPGGSLLIMPSRGEEGFLLLLGTCWNCQGNSGGGDVSLPVKLIIVQSITISQVHLER